MFLLYVKQQCLRPACKSTEYFQHLKFLANASQYFRALISFKLVSQNFQNLKFPACISVSTQYFPNLKFLANCLSVLPNLKFLACFSVLQNLKFLYVACLSVLPNLKFPACISVSTQYFQHLKFLANCLSVLPKSQVSS